MDPNMESSGRLCYEWFAQCTTFVSLLTVHAVVPTKDKKIHYNFIRSIRDQCAPSTVHDNPMQFIHDVYLQCNEMMDAFAKLLPTAFSIATIKHL
ncbi:hypothetical protein Lal_00022517 [Lupinus albus]|nr:hypothetical protein Lal_00022517 [Lupinus albus]